MGILDSNIHMNGAGKTYQSFLNLADAAEQKGGKICDRTVRLVKESDGLATTTFNGTKGARVAQINDAREIFLYFIAQEFGYVAKINSLITEKDEQDAIEGSEEYSEFVNTSADLLFILNPEIAGGVRNLDAGNREALVVGQFLHHAAAGELRGLNHEILHTLRRKGPIFGIIAALM